MKGWTICIEHNNQFRKLSKIQFTKEGGFSVIMPYHKAREGVCFKVPHDPVSFKDSKFEGFTPLNFMSDYKASSRVKMTYHADGFVHFSSEEGSAIRSGRYPDGSPKGLGIFVAPLRTPITSGPSIGFLTWGVDDYDLLRHENNKSNFLKVRRCEADYRRCNKDKFNAYLTEIFVFSHVHSRSIFTDALGRERLFLTFPDVERAFAWFSFFVIRIPNSMSFLGILISRVFASMHSTSGFTLSGPTDRKWSLLAMYPPPPKDFPPATGTIDYDQSTVEIPLQEKKYRRYRVVFQANYYIITKDDGLWVPEQPLRKEFGASDPTNPAG